MSVKIAKGDLIKLNKTGTEEIKIPHLDKNGQQTGWKTTQRNQWEMENLGLKALTEINLFWEKYRH
ncbi:hypothetical protein [Providencia rustigianii]|uniref:hypothetical protein n=1 Tax=Providencia rustigianii TaxID=158850 RepID=UPI0035E6154B